MAFHTRLLHRIRCAFMRSTPVPVVEDTYDIVDDSGVQTGQRATFSEVHSKGLRHGSVEVYVITPEREVLLQRRGECVSVEPLKWHASSAGHVNAGNTPVQTAVQELKEEVNMDVIESDMKLVASCASDEIFNDGTFINKEYKYLYVTEKPVSLADLLRDHGEVEELQLIPVAAFIEKLSAKDSEFVINTITPCVLEYLRSYVSDKN